MFDVHVLGAVLTIKAVPPAMIDNQSGRIVTFGSVAAPATSITPALKERSLR